MEEIREVPLYPNFRATSTGKILGLHGEEIGCFKGKYVTVGTRNGRPYKPFDTGKKSTTISRGILILLAFKGLPPPVLLHPEVDHINRNKHDDRPENLRWADRYDQMRNRDFQKNSTTLIKGLVERHHWQCQVKHMGKEYNKCFPFDQKDEAIQWLAEKRQELGIK
jgi:hypothetical protein